MPRLSDIPFYGAFTERTAQNEQAGLDDLKQASVLQAIYASMQQQDMQRQQEARVLDDRARNERVRAAIAALPPEKRTRENVLPILLEHSANPSGVAMQLPASAEAPKGQPIGSGGLRMPDGTVIPPAARPETPKPPEVKPPHVRQRFDGLNVIQEQQQPNGTFKEIGRGPRFNPKEGTAGVPTKPPSGYRATADGNLEAIPGGPADAKATGVYNQDTATLQNLTGSMDRLATAANEVMKHPGIGGITGLTGAFPDRPGSAAANARAKLQTLKAQVGFGVLQDMRNASRTGGALGSVTEAEHKLLQNALAALETSQDEKQMKESLQKIVEYANAAKDRIRNAYNVKHKERLPEGAQAPQTQPGAPQGQGGALSPEEQAELDRLRKKYGR